MDYHPFRFVRGSERERDWLVATLLAIHDGVLVIDQHEIVRFINPEYTRITGVPPDKILGKPLREVRPGAQLVDTLWDGKERVGIYRKEGSIEYVVDMAPIVIDNKTVGAVSICKSLTEVHTLSLELEKNRQTLTRLKNKIGSLYEARYTFAQIKGANNGLKEAVRIGKKAAEADLPVLITGESGTGKELFAQAIHNGSERATKPFIPVNCAAIPAALIESELFGYEDGSFTTAKKGGKVGLFEIASGGTVFLDEIGELSYELQAKLLRVLQEQTIRRIGEVRERKIDVRIIAATNRNLQQMIEKQLFREDLFYRLHVLNIHIPPLRERKEDLHEIIQSILQSSSRKDGNDQTVYRLNEEALQILKSYDWFGNVRELKNAIEYAICMTDNKEILPDHLPLNITGSQTTKRTVRTLKEATEDIERQCIREGLIEFGSDVDGKKQLAKSLGISLATLYNKINRYKLE